MKKIFILLVLCFHAHVSYAGEWITDEKSGCKVWNPAPVSNETITWSGACKDNYAEGKGTLYWYKSGQPNGKEIVNRHNGKAHGYGKIIRPNGDITQGLWRDDFFILECTSLSDCNRREAAKRKNEAYDRAHACDKFYSGKAIRFKPAGFIYFGSELDAVVLGKGNGNISIKIVDSSYHDDYGKTLEVSCNSDQLR